MTTPGQEFPCPSCGAPNMAFDASAQLMRCQYCQHTVAVQPQAPAQAPAPAQAAGQAGGFGQPAGQAGQAAGQAGQAPAQAQGFGVPAHQAAPTGAGRGERPLQEGLQQEQQGGGGGLGTAARALKCNTCGAQVSFPSGQLAQNCDFCGSQHVIESQAGSQGGISPSALVPFAVDNGSAKGKFKDWMGSLWFRPSDLKSAAEVGDIAGVYVPYWSFDAWLQSQWQAEAGYYYYENEVVVEMVNGQKQQRTKQVRKTRWQPAHGQRRDFHDDVLVVASKGLPKRIADKMRTFDTAQLQPYDPRFLSGFRAEEYGVGLAEAWQEAEQRMFQDQERACSGDVPGDTQRGLRVQSHSSQQMFKHILLPLWIASYQYNGKAYRFLVNGQTGEVQGEAPWSVIKIVLFIATIIAIIAGIVILIRSQQG